MKDRILSFIKGLKVSLTEIILLVVVWGVVVYRFSGHVDINSEGRNHFIDGDYVEPNYHAPHPSQFPYIEK